VAVEALLEELTATLGSRHEARWVLAELATREGDDAQHAALARGLAARRVTGEPLQYLLGHWPFRDLDLLVDPRALIPRPETEVLVDLALTQLVARGHGAVACDLGCGTGAIALALAIEAARAGIDVELFATDLDSDALELASANAARVGAERVTLHRGSWYEALPTDLCGRVDVCCSNPPYISHVERRTLSRELDFEPQLALVADDGSDGTPGFAAIESVITGAREWLAPHGTLFVEHADKHRDAASALAVRCDLVVVADHDDLAGRPRVLEAMMPS
jgi:release factor glutamine methyltransferase